MSGAKIDPQALRVVLATDCGSTTTKAVLFEKKPEGWRQTYRGEAPTTVEAPFDDVTLGAVNAITEVEELSGRPILDREALSAGSGVFLPLSANGGQGIDLYVSTSSAGGGLQMMVTGVVRTMTAESAQRAALGAGAIVMDVVSIDDGRRPHERIQRIRHLRPDIVLLSGGTDGGTVSHVVELAETILSADPRPRFGTTLKLPVIYAGNLRARQDVAHLLGEHFAFQQVPNLRPALERENLGPAREAIHEVFLAHVMSHAPGYDKLMRWTSVDIMSTPHAVGEMVKLAGKSRRADLLAVDIGGATTDVFSFVQPPGAPAPVFNRTVSANLGLSYSVCNVLLEAGIDQIVRWLPFELAPETISDRLRNKMIRPTTIPQLLEDLLLEQAVAREALRLAFSHHRQLAVGLKGVQQERTISDAFAQTAAGAELIDLARLGLIVGSGGVLSHAPDRKSAALMLLDAFQPEGVTELAVDSIFMMPHLGVLASVHPEAAAEIFERDCLVRLGTAVAAAGKFKRKAGAALLEYEIALPGGPVKGLLAWGELARFELSAGETARGVFRPLSRKVDLGAGPGRVLEATLTGGQAGVILDARGRPIALPDDPSQRAATVAGWLRAMGVSLRPEGGYNLSLANFSV